jgi:hypothetical protein
MAQTDFDLSQGVEILRRTPLVLRAWLSGLSEDWTRCNEGEDTWNAYDVVGHLVHGERSDWIPRIRQILEGRGGEPFPPFDRLGHVRESEGKDLATLLEEFEEARKESLAALDALNPGPDDFHRPGTHPDFGPVCLGQLLATWVTHDLTHLAQIARVMAKRNTEAVGPWKAYLSILAPLGRS